MQDLKLGLKLLWNQKAFSFAALLTLALCIGANTAIFTVLNTVVLRGLPFPEPDRIVTMYNLYPGVGVSDRGSNGVPDFLDRRKMTDVFEEVALIGYSGYAMGQDGSPQRINGQYVTPSYFRTLRIQPILGRVFTEEEAIEGKDKVAVLGAGLWKSNYAEDRNIVGTDIRLNGVPRRIIGVVPDDFGLSDEPPRIWVPFAFTPQQTSDDARHSNNWGMLARLKPGVTVVYAQQRLDTLNKENLERFPKFREILKQARFGTRVIGLQDELIRDIRPTLYLLQAAVFVVLLIGCVNLANLLLVRSNLRMKELAIRFSLGANRWRLGRQLLTESVVLSLVGGSLGIAVGYAGVRLLASLGAQELPRGSAIQIDGFVLAFTAAVAVLTGLAFGAVPLVHVMRRDLNAVFRDNDRSGTAGHRSLSLRSALVVCQVSLAFILLVGSGLLTFSFIRLLSVNPGFQPDNVASAQFSLPRSRYKDDAVARSFISGLLEKVRSSPGVQYSGATTYLPFSGNNNSSVITIEEQPLAPGDLPPVPGWNTIDSGYFAAMRIPLIQGRAFVESDGPEAQKVVVIDQFLARKYWPKGDPIGSHIRRGIEKDKDSELCTIIGVVGSVKTGSLAEQNPVGQVYYHYKQFVPRNMHLVLRSQLAAPLLTSAVRKELLSADPELPLFDTKTMPDRVSASVRDKRAAMFLCAIFGALALLLAAIGVYGVLAYSVTQRTREIGIRTALGAGVRDILEMVLWQGLRVTGLGLVIGATASFLLMRLITALLYDVKPSDPVVFLLGTLILGAVAAIASLVPSLRAARIRPSVALRYE